VGAAAAPDDVGVQDAASWLAVGVLDAFVQPARGGGAEFAHRLAGGGEHGEAGGESVVPAGDGDVGRDGVATAPWLSGSTHAETRATLEPAIRELRRSRTSTRFAVAPQCGSAQQEWRLCAT
jgi:hypothetical protein